MTQDLADEYQTRFSLDAWERVAHPAALFTPEFTHLVRVALKNGEPITRAQVEKFTGPLNWDQE